MHHPPRLAHPGTMLPHGVVDAPRHLGHADPRRATTILDIAGGLCFATLVSFICVRVGSSLLAGGAGWGALIGWEAVWVVAAILCAPLLPTGIAHDISWRSTFDGLVLDWPELVYTVWVLGIFTAYLGGLTYSAGAIGMSLAVGTAEELLFRVLILGWLVTRVDAPRALLISAVIFGCVHLNELSLVGFMSVVPQFAGGMVLGAVYLRTRNPIGPILAHAFWDLPYFAAMGGGVSGGSAAGGMPSVASLIPWLFFTVYGLWLVRDGIPLPGRTEPVGRLLPREG